eukprot:Hpha_TRINITY_DN24857_c0_g1::TRINITY_DN24857_c0_g1_i1::g.97339::m.97339
MQEVSSPVVSPGGTTSLVTSPRPARPGRSEDPLASSAAAFAPSPRPTSRPATKEQRPRLISPEQSPRLTRQLEDEFQPDVLFPPPRGSVLLPPLQRAGRADRC